MSKKEKKRKKRAKREKHSLEAQQGHAEFVRLEPALDRDIKAKKKAKKAAKIATTATRAEVLDAPAAVPYPAPAAMPASLLAADLAEPGNRALSKARAQWEHGDWESLLQLSLEEIASDPDRAKLALIFAAAQSHSGDLAEARAAARQAVRWGASRDLTARVLLSATQNSLARVSAALDEDATPHFEAAIRLVQPHADAPLLARSRRLRELAGLGLLPQAATALAQELQLTRQTGAAREETVGHFEGQLQFLRGAITKQQQAIAPNAAKTAPPQFNPQSLETYLALSPARQKNFIYLDVKSLPRTGLHFMRNSFESLLREHFSFCEWYNEPGCCRQFPCAITGYANEVQNQPALRMIKSHDFDLTDASFGLDGALHRLILLRDPLYLLTSWWSLQVLYEHSALLRRHGLRHEKVSFSHDAHVVNSAYRLIDTEGEPITTKGVQKFLQQKIPYICGFTSKWAGVLREQPKNSHIVHYPQTPDTVLAMIERIAPSLPDEVMDRVRIFRANRDQVFRTRQDPFHSKSTRITESLIGHQELFTSAVAQILQQDRTGLLTEAAKSQG